MGALKAQLDYPSDNSWNATPGYTTYAICLLAVINLVNYMDRMLLSVLLPSIQNELRLSDAQLGWLTGMAFAVFYGLAGIPIARLADRWVRKRIIAISIACWSAMTMLTGATTNFISILVARMGVGVGEAGCIPTSHSMISDLVKPERRAGALAVFTAGSTLGMLLGLGLGGWLGEALGWRWTFVVFGVPGILLGGLVCLTLREPRRGTLDTPLENSEVPTSTHVVLRDLFSRPTYVHVVLGFAGFNLIFFAFGQWLPSYYLRSFDLTMTQVGLISGFGLGIGMTAGALCGGLVANRLITRETRWGLWIPMIAALLTIPSAALLAASDTLTTAVACNLALTFVFGASTGPIFATVMALATPGQRATAAATNGLVSSLIGVGGGPLIVGYLSEYFATAGTENSLQAAFGVVAMFGVWPALHFYRASRSFTTDHATLSSPGHSGRVNRP